MDKKSGRDSPRKGVTLTEDTKNKISKSKTGKPRDQSIFESARQSMAVYGSRFHTINCGTIWINNGIINKRIKPEQLESYPGFMKGRDRTL
jgi:hypothetical protein